MILKGSSKKMIHHRLNTSPKVRREPGTTQVDREGWTITLAAPIQMEISEGTQQAGQAEQGHDG
jgi:hypothetical protein